MTYQIIYSSDAATPMQMEDLEEILEHARSRNARTGVTGALVYIDGVFLQILEGDFDTIQQLMAKISADVRHEEVTVLQEAEIPAAVFEGWEMAYIGATNEQVAQWAGLSGTTAVPDIFENMRNNAAKVAQVSQSILAALSADPDGPKSAE